MMGQNFVAVDLGASSGRVMLGCLAGGRLELAEQNRFENGPVEEGGALRWDIQRLEHEIRVGVERAFAAAGEENVAGVGVDSWGVDYVLVGADGEAVGRPFHYRDGRTDSTYVQVCDSLGREEIYRRTGIQFMQINTIYQLAAEDAERLKSAERFLMMADWFAHRLGGRAVQEVTLASTSQLVDPVERNWDAELVGEVNSAATGLLPELVEAGTEIGECRGAPVFASASHDTAAAVAGCPGKGDDWAFLSSGTWSLLGMEIPEPVTAPEALAAGLSNELGVNGTVRLLRNIMGLWLLQECRAAWKSEGRELSWPEISALAEKAPALASVVDPDDAPFLTPGDMPGKVRAFCERSGQAVPTGEGAIARAVLEALALKSRLVVESLEAATGRAIGTINMIGGGIQNRLLCQMTADATGRRVLAGPVEATASGNVLTQAIGARAISGWEEAREIVAASCELVEYRPRTSAQWDDACAKLRELATEG